MADDQLLNQLKQKYGSVISAAPQMGISLSHVHIQNGKLFIQGAAPNQDIKNQIWNVIKQVDPTFSDLTADISIDPSLPAPAQTRSAAPVGSAGGGQSYTVQSGDTLSKISKQFYGDASQYMKIFEANRDKLNDPNMIQVGQNLTIPS